MKRQRLSGILGLSLAVVGALCVSSAVAVAADIEVTPDVVYGHKYGMALTFDVLKPVDANGAAFFGWRAAGGGPAGGQLRTQSTATRRSSTRGSPCSPSVMAAVPSS